MDSIGDYLTIIRNASNASNPSCHAQWSKIREGITKILKEQGYIDSYHVAEDSKGFKNIYVQLKYVNEVPAITKINRVSKPGCRRYFQFKEIPRVLGGLGISILTTSKGVIDDKQARNSKVGGELLCNVW